MIKIYRRLLLLATTALLPLGPAFAQNLPTGGQFVGGTSGAISSSGNTMTVQTNSNRSITNWTTFNIGSGYQVNINQPNSGSVALERVTGGLGPSSIFGTLTSNGIVFLLNPNGILFGRGAVVNVGGFLASTNRISNSDFLAGHYRFHGGNPSVSIVNYGSITAATGGFAALVAPGVRNSGTITATLGTVGLAAGRGFSLDLYGDNLINLAVNDKLAKQVIDVATGQPLSSLITNTGKISANGGRVEITAAAARNIVSSVINTTGVIEANSIGRHDGMIVLNGGSGNVQVAGTLSASGKRKGTKGGTIEIAGENISVTGAKINASGKDGGGTVLIGGSSGRNYGGGGFSDNAVRGNDWSGSQNAQNVTINSRSLINVSAYERGSGGTVSIESNQLTTFAGLIEATGGRFDGRGGNVVTQGGAIDIAGARVNTGAPNGRDGSWLIEAMTLNIDPGAAAAIQASLATTNVTLQTNARYSGFEQNVANGTGDITINAPITWSTRNALTLDATNAVTVNATIDVAGPGKVNIRAATDPNYGIAQLAFGSGGSVQFTGTPDSGQALSINGQSYTLLYSMSGLQSIIDGNLSGNYALAKPLDATSVASWVPIGTNESGSMNGNGFTGIFQGLGNTISNLTIAPTAQNLDSIGFFGSIGVGGVVENLKLTNATVTANQFLSDSIPGQFVGVLAGENAGLIENVSVSGTVNGGTATGVNAGGLVGQNGVFGPGDFQAAGTVRNARADVNVILGSGCSGDCNGGYNSAGGLVGFNPGVIAHSEARGAIVVGSNAAAGGLVGTNGNYQQTEDGGSGGPIAGAKIYDSRASGTVSSAGVNVSLGGLVGQNNALSFIGRSRASGAVTSIAVIDPNQNCNDGGNCQTVSAGGLVGQNAGIIIRSAAHGDVSVENFAQAGGLVGINQGYRGEEGWYATAKIIDSFASGAVTSSGVNITIGGLVGLNGPGATITRSKAFGDVTSTANISAETNQNCDSGNCQYVNAGGLAGQNAGVIVRSSAHGDVTVGSFAQAGGLVGLNGGVFGDLPIRGAAIFDSSASGAVSSSGVSVTLGGLVGENQAGSLIKNSRATSDVTSTASSQGDCANNANCLNSVVGGLVGQNSGVIAGRWFDGTPTKCRSGDTCASGTVSVGSEGIAGGLVGDNTGIIKNAFAIANVIGAAGSPGASQHEFNNQTTLGGFAGVNSGLIKNSFAVGTVGSSGVNWLQAGGFVGDNSGVISRSFANVAVSAGDNSVAGGFAGSNAQNVDSSCCGGGNYNNKALITRSAAIGDVSVGASSIAGGFAAYGDGSFYRVSGSGAVSALGNSTVGGLVGALDVGGTISRSKADNTLVSSTGPNSTVGGLVGANGGTVSNSISTSPVTGGADSFIGGLAGANFGSITNSKVDPVITGNGPNDVLGGIVGLNIGQLSGNTANVMLVSNGSGNQVGSVAGVNGTYNFTGANPFTPGASTQTGDIGNSTSTGSSFSSIGSTVPPSAPAFPNWVPNCSATLCDGINNGFLQTAGGNQSNTGDTGNSNSGVNGNYGSQQTASFTVPPIPNNNTSLNLNAPNFNQQSGGAGGIGGNSANGGTNGGGSNNGATGSSWQRHPWRQRCSARNAPHRHARHSAAARVRHAAAGRDALRVERGQPSRRQRHVPAADRADCPTIRSDDRCHKFDRDAGANHLHAADFRWTHGPGSHHRVSERESSGVGRIRSEIWICPGARRQIRRYRSGWGSGAVRHRQVPSA